MMKNILLDRGSDTHMILEPGHKVTVADGVDAKK